MQCVAASQGSGTKVLGWLPLGTIIPGTGEHVLELRISSGTGPLGTRFMLDAICLSPEPFVPNYRHQPDTDDHNERAEVARQRVVKVPDTPALQRARTSLNGLWEIAPWDPFESDPARRLQGDLQLPELARLPWYGIQQPGDRVLAGDSREFTVERGGRYIFNIAFQAPEVDSRQQARFRLQVLRDGQVIFQDDKPAAVLAPARLSSPAITGNALAVCDPRGNLTAYLDGRGIAYRRMAPDDAIPPGTRLVVIGPDAIAADTATDMRWLRFAAAGGRVLVLDQQHPLRHQAIPAEARISDRSGRIGFLENPGHPIFADMRQADFVCFGPGHLLYRQAYTKPGSGGRSLIQCDDRLRFSPMIECAVGDGLMLLSQVAVSDKLASSGVAQQLVGNLLNHVAAYTRIQRELVVQLPNNDPRAKLLRDIGLGFEQATDPLAALQSGMCVAVLDADPATLASLAAQPERLDAFTAAGGWLMLWGLDEQGLADFNRLAGNSASPMWTGRSPISVPRRSLAWWSWKKAKRFKRCWSWMASTPTACCFCTPSIRAVPRRNGNVIGNGAGSANTTARARPQPTRARRSSVTASASLMAAA